MERAEYNWFLVNVRPDEFTYVSKLDSVMQFRELSISLKYLGLSMNIFSLSISTSPLLVWFLFISSRVMMKYFVYGTKQRASLVTDVVVVSSEYESSMFV